MLGRSASLASMAALSIRDLDDGVRDRLRTRAAQNGRSMEAEAQAILADAVAEPARHTDLFTALHERFQELGGVELDLPIRESMRPPPAFSE